MVKYYIIFLTNETVAGVEQSKCANIEILFTKGKISEIYEYDNPEGFIDPPLPISPAKTSRIQMV